MTIEQVTRIDPNKGTYVVQFPEGTDDETRTQWAKLYETAKANKQTIILEPGVKVVELDSVTTSPPPVSQPVPATVTSPTVTETSQIPPETGNAPVVQPAPDVQTEAPLAAPVAPQIQQLPPGYIPQEQVQFYQPQYQVAQGPPMQYNPFFVQARTGMQPVVVQAPPQNQVVYYPGVAPQYPYAPEPQPMMVPVQRVYNPQLAEGPIGQRTPTLPPAKAPERTGGPDATLRHPSYAQQQGTLGTTPEPQKTQ